MQKLTAIFACVILSGCTYQIPAYSPEPSVAATLKGARSKVNVAAAAPGFADDGSIICRGAAPVSLPNGQTFTQYVSEALRTELASGGAYDAKSKAELRMKLLRVDFQTTLGATNWYIDAEYVIGGGSYAVSTVYNDRSSYFGDKACSNMALYFRPAIARHVGDVFRHPAFRNQVGFLEAETADTARSDISTRLRRLDALLKDGLISREEYDSRRKQIIDGI